MIFFKPNLKIKNNINDSNVITDEVFSPVIITPSSKKIDNINILLKFTFVFINRKQTDIKPNLNRYNPGINSSSNGPDNR